MTGRDLLPPSELNTSTSFEVIRRAHEEAYPSAVERGKDLEGLLKRIILPLVPLVVLQYLGITQVTGDYAPLVVLISATLWVSYLCVVGDKIARMVTRSKSTRFFDRARRLPIYGRYLVKLLKAHGLEWRGSINNTLVITDTLDKEWTIYLKRRPSSTWVHFDSTIKWVRSGKEHSLGDLSDLDDLERVITEIPWMEMEGVEEKSSIVSTR